MKKNIKLELNVLLFTTFCLEYLSTVIVKECSYFIAYKVVLKLSLK